MAMACFGFVTFLPLRPDFSLPFFISRISLSTFFPADGEYLRRDDFWAAVLRALFFVAVLREVLLDFFFVAFLVAITILLGVQMAPLLRQVAWEGFTQGYAID
jgi:hypothetical protein